MKLLHISKVGKNKAGGMLNIVPKIIESQNFNNNIALWLNLNDAPIDSQAKLYKINFNKTNDIIHKFDLVVFHGIFFYEYLKIYKKLIKYNVPYVIVPHGSMTKTALSTKKLKKMFALNFVFKSFLSNAMSLQYLTHNELLNSKQKYNYNKLIIPNGVDKPNKTISNKDLHNKSTIKIIFVGRINVFFKGLDILLEAINHEKDFFIKYNVQFDFYGKGLKKDEQFVSKFIEKNELVDIVNLKGPVYGDKKEKAFLKGDIFILTSRSEGHPVALLEALSYGLPVFITPETNMGSEVQKYNAGYTCPLDPIEISERLIEMILDKNYSVMSKNAVKLSENYYWDYLGPETLEKYQKKINELYSEIEKGK